MRTVPLILLATCLASTAHADVACVDRPIPKGESINYCAKHPPSKEWCRGYKNAVDGMYRNRDHWRVLLAKDYPDKYPFKTSEQAVGDIYKYQRGGHLAPRTLEIGLLPVQMVDPVDAVDLYLMFPREETGEICGKR